MDELNKHSYKNIRLDVENRYELPYITPYETNALLIRHVIDRVKKMTDETPTDLVVSIPSNYCQHERIHLKDSFGLIESNTKLVGFINTNTGSMLKLGLEKNKNGIKNILI